MAKRRSFPLPLLIVLVVALPVLGAFLFIQGRLADDGSDVPLSNPLHRGPMIVSVLESGSLEALESHSVRSTVEGRTEIIYIIPEGTMLTADDVAAGTVLVKLDDSSLRDKIDKQSIDLTAAKNSLEAAEANLEIQMQQNDSDIRNAELDARFGLLDLIRYVGEDLGALLQRDPALLHPSGVDPDSGGTIQERLQEMFHDDRLLGEALQTRRKLTSDIELAKEELSRAKVKLDWSIKLEAKGYASKDDLEADRLNHGRRTIDLQLADTALTQYAEYDFPKEVESLSSELLDARERLDRARKRAESALNKSQSEVETKRRQLELQQQRMSKLSEQLAGCVFVADRPGLVVYGSSGKERHWRDNEQIQEGTSIRERQEILRIPELGNLGARISVHESVVNNVRPGLAAKVIVDAMPDHEFDGVVQRRAPLPSATNRWLNPNLKVYDTLIELHDEPDMLKPGMSVQVEIVLDELENALAVPVQAVAGTVRNPVVYVFTEDGAVRTPVELGLSNDSYVEVLSGVKEGDRVLLVPPREERDEAAEDALDEGAPAAPDGKANRGS